MWRQLNLVRIGDHPQLSVLIQHCNAVAVLGTFAHTTPEDEM